MDIPRRSSTASLLLLSISSHPRENDSLRASISTTSTTPPYYRRRRAKSLDSANRATQASARQIRSLAGHFEACASTISTAALKKRGVRGKAQVRAFLDRVQEYRQQVLYLCFVLSALSPVSGADEGDGDDDKDGGDDDGGPGPGSGSGSRPGGPEPLSNSCRRCGHSKRPPGQGPLGHPKPLFVPYTNTDPSSYSEILATLRHATFILAHAGCRIIRLADLWAVHNATSPWGPTLLPQQQQRQQRRRMMVWNSELRKFVSTGPRGLAEVRCHRYWVGALEPLLGNAEREMGEQVRVLEDLVGGMARWWSLRKRDCCCVCGGDELGNESGGGSKVDLNMSGALRVPDHEDDDDVHADEDDETTTTQRQQHRKRTTPTWVNNLRPSLFEGPTIPTTSVAPPLVQGLHYQCLKVWHRLRRPGQEVERADWLAFKEGLEGKRGSSSGLVLLRHKVETKIQEMTAREKE
ncbi:hypothetical protein F4778DRAFT_786888 [Xylariomycetidae sp. FL2044]|nr:hypothetical protein F4778DRAFT_786888 [Xylariomycetidae sp. FL2044]